MRKPGVSALLWMWTLPSVCFGLLLAVSGNRPQPEANYKDWPNLVDVVNDPARTRLVWWNGNESCYYRGKTEALNRLLGKFSKVEADELRVVLRPELKEPTNDDASLQVVGGISRAAMGHDDTPTLTIFLTDNLQIKDLVVPENLVVEQLADLRKHYEEARRRGSQYAARSLESLDADAARQGENAKRYAADLRTIRDWIRSRNASQMPLKP